MFDLDDYPDPERLFIKEFKIRSPKEMGRVNDEMKAQMKMVQQQHSVVGKVKAKFLPMARQLQSEVAQVSALLAEATAKLEYAEDYLGMKAKHLKMNWDEGETAHRMLSDNYDSLVEMFDTLKKAHAKAEKSGAAGDWDKAELAARAYDKAVRNGTNGPLQKASERLGSLSDQYRSLDSTMSAVREAMVAMVTAGASLGAAVRRDAGRLETSVRDAERVLRGAE